jgi:hypothetical protein
MADDNLPEVLARDKAQPVCLPPAKNQAQPALRGFIDVDHTTQ